MDLQLFGRVMWRFRFVVAGGLVLALVLSTLTLLRIDRHGVSYRRSEQWVSYSTLFVTQPGFPWGWAVAQSSTQPTTTQPTVSSTGTASAAGSTAQRTQPPALADPARLAGLAVLYSRLASADAIHQRVDPRTDESVQIAPVLAGQGSSTSALPLISVAAISPSPVRAISLARKEVAAFRAFLVEQQARSQIPVRERVVVNVLNRAKLAQLYRRRSLTLPIVVFLTVLTAAIGLAFILENLRPRVRAVEGGRVAERTSA
jgi:hypothetical protein